MKQNITSKIKMLTIYALIAFTPFTMKGTELVGAGQYYPTLKSAFDDINNGTLTGNVELELTSSTLETAPCILNKSGTGFSSYVGVKVYPSGSGYTINGAIELLDAEHVVIDGRVNQTGTTADLTILSTGAAITLSDASYNKITYCKLKGMINVIDMTSNNFSGTIDGCNYNMISFNEISYVSKNSSNKALINSAPYSVVYNAPLFNNKYDTLYQNKLFNFVYATTTTNKQIAIQLLGKNYAWLIDGNSIYDAGYTEMATASNKLCNIVGINVIQVAGTNGSGTITIKNNYIGGSAPLCGGAPLTLAHNYPSLFSFGANFIGIQTNSGLTSDTIIVSNNTIANFSISHYNGNPFYGIYVGDGIATILNNTIGSGTGIGSLVFNGSSTGSNIFGIVTQSTDYTLINQNTIGSVTITPGNNYPNLFTAISNSINSGTTISFNNIGSSVTPNSIQSIGTGSNSITGISITGGSAMNNLIDNNTINNLSAIMGKIVGINTTGNNGLTTTISNNKILNLTSTQNSVTGIQAAALSSNIVTTNINANEIGFLYAGYATDATVAVGIDFTAGALSYITNNKVHHLYSTTTSASNMTVVGISNSSPVYLKNNFITNLSTQSTGPTTVVYGIFGGEQEISNNIISIGTTSRKAYGIYTSFAYMYHNTIYVGGANANAESACLWINTTPNGLYCQNNIFVNNKQNISGTTVRHLCIKQLNPTMWSNNFNLFYAPNITTGAGIGRIGAVDYQTFSTYQSATTQNSNSINIDPLFINAGADYESGYYPTASVIGTVATWGLPLVNNDYFNTNRNPVFWMGALQSQAPLPLTWKSFFVNLNENKEALLTWITSSEKNTMLFKIEKSSDSKKWTTIAELTAAGSSDVEKKYSYLDQDVSLGTSYYRIKQIDEDNRYSYSTVQKIYRETLNQISMYPNPCTSTLNISLNNISEPSLIEVYSIDGLKLMSEQSTSPNHILKVDHLSKGTYIIRISTTEKTFSSKFVRQ